MLKNIIAKQKHQLILKIIATGSLIGILLLSPSFAYAAGATLSFAPSSGTVSPDCSFNVDIVVDTGGSSTDGSDAVIKFDSSKLSTSADKITKGAIYDSFPFNPATVSDGKVAVSGIASLDKPFTGKGVLATIQFTVLPGANTGTTLVTYDYTQGSTTDSNIVESGTIRDLLTQPSSANYTLGTSGCVTSTSGNPNVTGNPPKNVTTITKPVGALFVDTNSNGIDDSSESGLIKKPLPDTAITTPTFVLIIGGGLLTILGILGLAML